MDANTTEEEKKMADDKTATDAPKTEEKQA